MNEAVVPPPPPPGAPEPTRNPFKRVYRWVLSWAHHPAGTWVLAVLAFLDSAVFPVPPLFLQVALSIERPRRSWWYAFVNTVFSVAGACLGYAIGFWLWDAVGRRIVGDITPGVRRMIEEQQFLWTFVYSFIPLPYKLMTIGSGLLHVPLATLLVASTLGRSLRFFILAAVCRFKGAQAKDLIDRYFNVAMFAVGALVILLALAMRFLARALSQTSAIGSWAL